MNNPNEIEKAVRSFILIEFLPGEDPSQLTNTTPLITAGILDSFATLKLVGFLEKEFSIIVEAHEADVENLDTIEDISRFVQSKVQLKV
jgi:acyl carrier protein